MLKHHSSRQNRLDQSLLQNRLNGAASYDRIAGYFRSSLFEIAGEALAQVKGPIRIVCNSDLDPQDLATAIAAQSALRRSWCEGNPEQAPLVALPRYQALYDALVQKRMEVRVLDRIKIFETTFLNRTELHRGPLFLFHFPVSPSFFCLLFVPPTGGLSLCWHRGISEKLGDLSTTPLNKEVKPGKNTIDIDL